MFLRCFYFVYRVLSVCCFYFVLFFLRGSEFIRPLPLIPLIYILTFFTNPNTNVYTLRRVVVMRKRSASLYGVKSLLTALDNSSEMSEYCSANWFSDISLSSSVKNGSTPKVDCGVRVDPSCCL